MASLDASALRRDHEGSGELFELSLYGGSPERYYRRRRPDVLAMPWSKLDVGNLGPEALVVARRGWTEAALEEYASAAEQARLVQELVRARAPLDLSAMASGFSLDELAHAELCARVAGALGGGVALAYESQAPPPPERELPAALRAAEIVVASCCVFETFAHAQLSELRKRAEDELRRAVWSQIAKDEALHARFGWIFIDWFLEDSEPSEKARLGRVAAHAIASLRAKIARAHRFSELTFAPGAPLSPFTRDSHQVFVTCALRERVEAPLQRRGLL